MLRHALLINLFYPKDPLASFGKHVLTPSLALTSIAATPEDWTLRYWDENLLQGPPSCDPFPEGVGITTHLTLAARRRNGCSQGDDARRNGPHQRQDKAAWGGEVGTEVGRYVKVSHPKGVRARS